MRHKSLPQIDGLYWALVISSTTLGETAGDLISQTLGFGYGGGTIVLLVLFAIAMLAEVLSPRSHASLYWTTLTLASIAGTTLADFASRSLGLGYPLPTMFIAVILLVTLLAWKLWTQSLDLKAELDRRGESLYWLAILASSTLGTAIGDFLSKAELDLDGQTLADTPFGEWVAAHHIPLAGLGVGDGLTAAILLALLVSLTCIALFTKSSRISCYWAGIIVTHPLGAAMGDYMTKEDGLHLGNAVATGVLAVVLAVVAFVVYRRGRNRTRCTGPMHP